MISSVSTAEAQRLRHKLTPADMSYGKAENYRPVPRDFNTLIQTCSSNIQKITQNSKCFLVASIDLFSLQFETVSKLSYSLSLMSACLTAFVLLGRIFTITVKFYWVFRVFIYFNAVRWWGTSDHHECPCTCKLADLMVIRSECQIQINLCLMLYVVYIILLSPIQ